MDATEMQAIVSGHLKAEGLGDIEHDAVGFPGSPRHGKAEAREFYEHLTANLRAETEEVLHRYVTGDAMVLEQLMTATIIGSMLDIPGTGRRISFRILHVFEFRDGLISRENVWLDAASIVAQLS